jgi:hypothetical protein
MPSKETTPSFAIYLLDQPIPYIFFASSEKKITEWLPQLSMHCTKYRSIIELNDAHSYVNMNGYAYFAYLDPKLSHKPYFMSQLDGHFRYVEKHASGITFGLSENGTLWVLENESNRLKASYVGSSTQTDEIEVYSYENQRWNVISGMMGLRNGFTSIGFPTDRFVFFIIDFSFS